MAEIRDQVANLLQDGWEVYTVDEVRARHEAETRRMWLPKGKGPKLYVDRKKASRSFFGALSLTTKKMRMARIKQNGILGQLLRDSWLAFTEGLL